MSAPISSYILRITNTPTRCLPASSSRGPACDGRIRPDSVCGKLSFSRYFLEVGLIQTRRQGKKLGDQKRSYRSDTRMAPPLVAGAVASVGESLIANGNPRA